MIERVQFPPPPPYPAFIYLHLPFFQLPLSVIIVPHFMEEIKINRIIRSKRKTIALVLTHDARLVIRAPLKTPVDYLENLVNEKRDWIRAKLLEIQSRPKPKAKEFVNGESFFCLGKSYNLEIVDISGVDIELKDNLLLSLEKVPYARDVVIKWYKSVAEKKIKSAASGIQVLPDISRFQSKSLALKKDGAQADQKER